MKFITSSVTAILGLFLMLNVAYAQDYQITSDKYFGCTNKDYFSKLIRYAAQKDWQALKQGLGAGLLTNECTLFKTGEEVFLVDTAIFSGMIKLRRKGEIAEYWTNLEAIK